MTDTAQTTTIKTNDDTSPLRGMITAVYHATDFEGAKKWYSELLGTAPYMDTPAYAEFRIGDDQAELGLLNRAFLPELGGETPASDTGGVILYWYVDDVPTTLDRGISLGATPHQPPRDFGRGFVGCSVVDPFGNILGIMNNPHYREVRGAIRG